MARTIANLLRILTANVFNGRADPAGAAGVDYPALLEQILRLGSNYQAAWRVDET